MKKPTNKWFQPEGWLTYGAAVVVGVLIVYLVYMVVGQFLPRLRTIRRSYDQDSMLQRELPRMLRPPFRLPGC